MTTTKIWSNLEMYQDQVSCFTPKGDVINYHAAPPWSISTYAIHTRIGHACVGAKNDGIARAALTACEKWPTCRRHHRRGSTPQAMDRHRRYGPRQNRDS
jgi:hypothetical protein